MDKEETLHWKWNLLNHLIMLKRKWEADLQHRDKLNGSDFQNLIRKDKLKKSIKALTPIIQEKDNEILGLIEEVYNVEIPMFHQKTKN